MPAPAGQESRFTASAPNFLARAIYRLTEGEVVITGATDIGHFNTLYEQFNLLCNPEKNKTLPNAIHDCWHCFNYETVREGEIYRLTNVPEVSALHKQYHEDKTGRHKHHPLGVAILSQLSGLKQLNKTNLNLAKIVFAYIANIGLVLTTMNPSSQAKEIHEIVEHLQKVTNLVFNQTKIRSLFSDSTAEMLRTLHTDSLPRYLNSHTPISDAIPKATADLAQNTQQIACLLEEILIILTEGGQKKNGKLPTSLEDFKRFEYDQHNPFSDMLRNVAQFVEALDQPARKFPFQAVSPPQPDAIEQFVGSCTSSATILNFRSADHALHYALLQELKTEDNKKSVVKWAPNSQGAVIKQSTNMLLQLSNWLQLVLFIAHKVRDLNYILTFRGQQFFINKKEAAFLKSFLTQLQTFLEQFKGNIEQIELHLSQRCRTSESDYEHNIFFKLQQLKETIDQVVTRSLEPLKDIDTILKKLAAIEAEIIENHFNEMEEVLYQGGFFQDFFDPLQGMAGFSLEDRPQSDRRPQPRELTAAASSTPTQRQNGSARNTPVSHPPAARSTPATNEPSVVTINSDDDDPRRPTPPPYEQKPRLNSGDRFHRVEELNDDDDDDVQISRKKKHSRPSSASSHPLAAPLLQPNPGKKTPMGSRSATPTTAQQRPVVVEPMDTDDDIDLLDALFEQNNYPHPPRSPILTSTIPSYAEAQAEHKRKPKTKKPHRSVQKTWLTALKITLGVTVVSFAIIVALACTGILPLPAFLIGVGLIWGGIALAGIVAGGVLALGLGITGLIAKFSKADPRGSSRRRLPPVETLGPQAPGSNQSSRNNRIGSELVVSPSTIGTEHDVRSSLSSSSDDESDIEIKQQQPLAQLGGPTVVNRHAANEASVTPTGAASSRPGPSPATLARIENQAVLQACYLSAVQAKLEEKGFRFTDLSQHPESFIPMWVATLEPVGLPAASDEEKTAAISMVLHKLVKNSAAFSFAKAITEQEKNALLTYLAPTVVSGISMFRAATPAAANNGQGMTPAQQQ
ncbi:MAG: hypothetical protein NTW08_06960 [Gammaproteobacteria bacterium]|nr:hypothetical protein [Gammaproteobacteria bacterium]